MKRPLPLVLVVLIAALAVPLGLTHTAAAYPEPSPYPISWELDFKHGKPKRIVVDTGQGAPRAYWYLTYTVINNTDQERTFIPIFELLTNEGQVIRSDRNIPYTVFQAIKEREGNRFLEHFTQVGGELRLGEDEAKEGVAIWQEPVLEMGRFSIFVTGLSGEAVILPQAEGQADGEDGATPAILRKTLQLNYHVRGDEVYPGEDLVDTEPEKWVMR